MKFIVCISFLVKLINVHGIENQKKEENNENKLEPREWNKLFVTEIIIVKIYSRNIYGRLANLDSSLRWCKNLLFSTFTEKYFL